MSENDFVEYYILSVVHYGLRSLRSESSKPRDKHNYMHYERYITIAIISLLRACRKTLFGTENKFNKQAGASNGYTHG